MKIELGYTMMMEYTFDTFDPSRRRVQEFYIFQRGCNIVIRRFILVCNVYRSRHYN